MAHVHRGRCPRNHLTPSRREKLQLSSTSELYALVYTQKLSHCGRVPSTLVSIDPWIGSLKSRFTSRGAVPHHDPTYQQSDSPPLPFSAWTTSTLPFFAVAKS